MDTFLQALISYLVIVDPVGVALIFHVLTAQQSPADKRRTATRAIMISFSLVVFFGFLGEWLLGQLGISLESFKIAGGLLLFYAASMMVVGSEQPPAGEDIKKPADISVFPLSIPLLAGPGCLTLTVLLFTGKGQTAADYILLLSAIGLVFIVSFICLITAGFVSGVLGETGNSIMKRLLGVLLAALSIQFIADGIRGFFQ